ncbi:MAG: D-sedoheptulose 7-phosphate isomerase, partial [Blastocatellia bacterium]|nr:D-sedoheptulose 7-phosphate isomerase [Blastocatellia bacterium]
MTETKVSALAAKTFQEHLRVIDDVVRNCLPQIEEAAELICNALRDGKKILLCGNGGSAADAQHIAAELVGQYERPRRGWP